MNIAVIILHPLLLMIVVAYRCVVTSLQTAMVDNGRIESVVFVLEVLRSPQNVRRKYFLRNLDLSSVLYSLEEPFEPENEHLVCLIDFHLLEGRSLLSTVLALHHILSCQTFFFLEVFEALTQGILFLRLPRQRPF